MSDTVKDIEAKVGACDCPEKAAECLVCCVADALDGLQQDPVAIKRMASELRERAATLGAAVTACCAEAPAEDKAEAPEPHHAAKKHRSHGK